jgi:flagellar biosynthesis/type III secretory pathway M-ring protein FliF/YscJ
VKVIYDPANPKTAQINKWTERWLFPIIIIPAMIFTALIVNFFLIRGFWRNDMTLIE